ncbi:MAG: hypothetical protein Q4E05_11670 [Pseudoclavibacter sp.]|nr:hypothetical protein [Pseudoclavibacter sp.]
MISDQLLALRGFVETLPPLLQWLGVALLSAAPFVESYFGSAAGVLAGLPLPVAVASAAVGNTLSMLAFVAAARAGRARILAGRAPAAPASPRRARIERLLHRYGVPLVSLMGQAVLPSQITSGIMVSLGARARQVAAWQIVSILLWGSLFAAIATGLAQLPI